MTHPLPTRLADGLGRDGFLRDIETQVPNIPIRPNMRFPRFPVYIPGIKHLTLYQSFRSYVKSGSDYRLRISGGYIVGYDPRILRLDGCLR